MVQAWCEFLWSCPVLVLFVTIRCSKKEQQITQDVIVYSSFTSPEAFLNNLTTIQFKLLSYACYRCVECSPEWDRLNLAQLMIKSTL